MAAAKKKSHGRSAGGYALARCGHSQVKIAEDVGVSKVTVHQWINGEKKPGKPKRDRIHELYGIAPESFDEPYRPAPKKPFASPPPVDDDASAAGGAFAMARALERQIQQQFDALEGADNEQDEAGNVIIRWTPAEKAQVTQRLASSINVLAKITGQHELGRRLMQLPQWKALERVLFDALKGFPDAAKVVAEHLERFEREWMAASE